MLMKKKPTTIDKEIELVLEEYHNSDDPQKKKDSFDRFTDLLKLKIDECKAENDRFDRWIKHMLEAAGIILPLGFYGVWITRGFEFEKDGAISSGVFRSLTRFFRPTK